MLRVLNKMIEWDANEAQKSCVCCEGRGVELKRFLARQKGYHCASDNPFVDF